MKLSNDNRDAIVANVDGRWYEIPVGETTEVDDYVVASTLVEYGATANADELQAARTLWASQNREINSAIASASASEGVILGRRQATVDVQSGTVTSSPEPLKGAALKAAVEAANEAGAEIASNLSADEKRDALAKWQVTRGTSTSLADEGVFLTDDEGDLVLDEDEQPFRLDELERNEDGSVKYDGDKPVVKALDTSGGEADSSSGGSVEKEVTPGTGGDPSAGTGGDGAGPETGPTDPEDPESPA